jgi:lysophospholipase L1-like esterase
MLKRWIALAAASFAVVSPLYADLKLLDNDVVAVSGDSITEQREYSVFIEDYLLMCKPRQNLRTAQFGWGGETAGGFLGRMANDVLWLKPTVATTCYGMNDGRYKPFEQSTGDAYRNATRGIIRKFKEAGVRVIIVGSPGVVDADTYRAQQPEEDKVYNATLAQLRDIARELAAEENVFFADVHAPMMQAMTKGKQLYGKDYHVGGGDGVHPDRNGQLVMAYAFLKAMGVDGDIGTISVDLAGNSAQATEGHKVLSASGGAVEVESSRYPFCFYGEPKKTSSTRGIIEAIPFNDDLNRFTLKVKGAGAGKVKVTWGDVSKEFDAAALEKGVNLAAEFADKNPFSEPFQKVEALVRKKQAYETPLHKTLLNGMSKFRDLVPEEKESFDRIVTGSMRKDKPYLDAAAAAVAPVKHVLKIEPAK